MVSAVTRFEYSVVVAVAATCCMLHVACLMLHAVAACCQVVIAKMDATANDIDLDDVNVEGFPTIMMWPATAKEVPLVYDRHTH